MRPPAGPGEEAPLSTTYGTAPALAGVPAATGIRTSAKHVVCPGAGAGHAWWIRARPVGPPVDGRARRCRRRDRQARQHHLE